MGAGGLVVIVEAKLELRESASWDTLDRAIKRVGGVAAAAVEGNGKGVPTATTAFEALSPRDSDDDESTGGAFVLPLHVEVWLPSCSVCRSKKKLAGWSS